jgi:hypothetical protein
VRGCCVAEKPLTRPNTPPLPPENTPSPMKQMNDPLRKIALQSFIDEAYSDKSFAEKALSNEKLYKSIVEHRRVFVGLKGFDYDTLALKTINILPPDTVSK